MNAKINPLATALSGALLAFAMTPVFADPPATFCLDASVSEAGDFLHYKLLIEPARGLPPYKIVPVHALRHGLAGNTPYIDQLSGTATIAPSNDPAISTPIIQIALTGNGYGVTDTGQDEIWTFHQNLQLDPKTLNGKIYGEDSESKPLVDGQPYEFTQRTALVRNITRMSCKDF